MREIRTSKKAVNNVSAFKDEDDEKNDEDALPQEIVSLKQQRDEARKARDFARSDALRAEIEAQGYAVGDSPQGTVVKKNLL